MHFSNFNLDNNGSVCNNGYMNDVIQVKLNVAVYLSYKFK